MPKRKTIIMEVGYTADQYFNGYDAVIGKVASKHKAEERGAGMAFGVRETSFDVPAQNAKAFEKDCRKLKHITYVETLND